MNKFTSLFAVPLLLASASAWSETDSSADLRYCLDIKSNAEIAKCAGETSPGSKGKPYTQEEADKIVSQEKTTAPATTNEPPVAPVAAPAEPVAVPVEPAAAPAEPAAAPVEPAASKGSSQE